MRRWTKAALVAAALVSGSLGLSQQATAAGAAWPVSAVTLHFGDEAAATDFSARRRASRSHRHVRKHARHRRLAPHYVARPHDYRPARGMAPFFPFGLGYGLEPSW